MNMFFKYPDFLPDKLWCPTLTLILGPQKNTHIQDLGSFLPRSTIFDSVGYIKYWHLRETDLKNIDDYILPG